MVARGSTPSSSIPTISIESRSRADAMAEASRNLAFGSNVATRAAIQTELGDSGDFCSSFELEEARARTKRNNKKKESRSKKRQTRKKNSNSSTTSSSDSRRYRNKLSTAVFHRAGLSQKEEDDDVISLSSSSLTESVESPPRRSKKKSKKQQARFEVPGVSLLRKECFRLMNKSSITKEHKDQANKLYRKLMLVDPSKSLMDQPEDIQVIYNIAIDADRDGFSSIKTVRCIIAMLYGAPEGTEQGDIDDISINHNYDDV
jgi:hypothetical protein